MRRSVAAYFARADGFGEVAGARRAWREESCAGFPGNVETRQKNIPAFQKYCPEAT